MDACEAGGRVLDEFEELLPLNSSGYCLRKVKMSLTVVDFAASDPRFRSSVRRRTVAEPFTSLIEAPSTPPSE